MCLIRSGRETSSEYEPGAVILKHLWSPGIDSKEWIPRAYVAWRAGTITLFLLGATSEQVTNFMAITMIAIVLYSTSTVFIVLYL